MSTTAELSVISEPTPGRTSHDDVELPFEQLRDLGWRAVEHGQLPEALRFCDRAVALARREEDRDLLDLAFCNRSAVVIALGRQQEVVPELREILVRSGATKNSFLAAYNLGRAYELDKSFQKGLFYGRIAQDHAQALGRSEWRASSSNLIANCLLAESYFAEAAAEYQRALARLPEVPSVRRALVLSNYGYCQMMMGHLRGGFELSFRALRWFRRFAAKGYEAWPHLDLCYAYLEKGRLDRALQHGKRALMLAEKTDDPTPTKNALYLLGEVEKASGDHEAAQGYFSRLQRAFYPESPRLAKWMAAVNIRQAINLRA